MQEGLQLAALLICYLLAGYYVTKLIRKSISNLNIYLRILVHSFSYALFWGIGIAGNGGEPGFGFPAPNFIAIALMASNKFYYGVKIAIYIMTFWWATIFFLMLARHHMTRKHDLNN